MMTKKSTEKKQNKTMHQQYREITVEMTDGTKFKTRSTYHLDYLKLDVDAKTHPAWTKEVNFVNTKASEVSKFNDRFGSLKFKSSSSTK